MLTLNKQDILKTVLIIWFLATTFYFVYDQYAGYKVRGMQAAYQQGYQASITELIAKSKESNCKGFGIKQGSEELNLIDVKCLQSQGDQQLSAPAQPQPKK